MNKHHTNIIYSQLSVGVIRPILLSIILAISAFPQTGTKDKSWADNQYISPLIININNNVRSEGGCLLNIKLKDHLLKIIITIVYTLAVELTTDHSYNKDRQGIFDVR